MWFWKYTYTAPWNGGLRTSNIRFIHTYITCTTEQRGKSINEMYKLYWWLYTNTHIYIHSCWYKTLPYLSLKNTWCGSANGQLSRHYNCYIKQNVLCLVTLHALQVYAHQKLKTTVKVVEKCERKNRGNFETLSFPIGIDCLIQPRNHIHHSINGTIKLPFSQFSCNLFIAPTKCILLNMYEF